MYEKRDQIFHTLSLSSCFVHVEKKFAMKIIYICIFSTF